MHFEVMQYGGDYCIREICILQRTLWGVGRNEHGDSSGWGSRIFYAEPNNLADWIWTVEKSNPIIYESVRMFRHGPELYLIARTDPEGTFQNDRGIEYEGLAHLIDLGKGFERSLEI